MCVVKTVFLSREHTLYTVFRSSYRNASGCLEEQKHSLGTSAAVLVVITKGLRIDLTLLLGDF